MTITRLKFRHGTTNEWNVYNPILEEGEPGFDITAKRFKMGDGVNPWANLPYTAVDPAQLTAMVDSVSAGVSTAQAASAAAAASAVLAEQAAENAQQPVTTDSAVAGAVNTVGSQSQTAVDLRVSAGVTGAAGDTVIAARINTAGTLTRTAVDGRVSAVTDPELATKMDKDSLVINALDHGVVRSSTVDQAAALNAVAELALSRGPGTVLYIPRGTYLINSMVTIKCDVYAPGVRFTYNGSGTALTVGDTTPGVAVVGRTYHLPEVAKSAQGWDGSSLGIDLVNLNTCRVYVPLVRYFERGLRCYGIGTGFVYNTVEVGLIAFNHRQFQMGGAVETATHRAGWANQNLFLNAQVFCPISAQSITAVEDDPNASAIELGTDPTSQPNNNTFINWSVENVIPAFYRLRCNGQHNRFINCRWEHNGGSSRVLWQEFGRYNTIEGGYDADNLVETYVDGSVGNAIYGARGGFINATNPSGFAVPANTALPFRTITGWNNSSVFANYNASNGAWTPRQGRWRITATIGVDGPAGGTIITRLVGGGTRLLDYDQKTAEGRTLMKMSCNERFTGTETLVAQIRQEATVGRSLTTIVGMVHLDAEYLGP
jgi:hypothetical protein